MRQKLLRAGADELSYEIRGIVRKGEQLKELGYEILWENIGDPIQKHQQLPQWMKTILTDLLNTDETYSYSHSKGMLATREFLAERTNRKNGVQIKPEDITFFNGLGDAIAKMYQYLLPTSRVIGPSPAYSTHSSAEAAHANHHPITYKLDPKNSWYPDLEDLYNKVKYNPSIVGMLIINPDNPTGMVYPRAILEGMVNIAREFDLFIISDEIYQNIVYNGASATALAEIISDLPGIALKGISKEIPWPGARCGWAEYYNRNQDPEFDRLCQTLDNAKMIEVSSTKLPQVAIPKILGHERYPGFRKELNERIGRRSQLIASILSELPQIEFNPTNGAFYNTIIFKDGVLKPGQSMAIKDQNVSSLLEGWLYDPDIALDKRFVYYMLAAKNVCVVPISSFCSDLLGFRVTLLEEDEEMLIETFTRIKEGILEYTA
ncbi:MAG: pyridoxal phosphate-dependent aminotransferase [Bacteroidota bacterium]